MDGIEGSEMGRVGENTIAGRPQGPEVCLCRTADITPIGVGICAAGHPQHWGRLRPIGTSAEGHINSCPLPGPWISNTGEGG